MDEAAGRGMLALQRCTSCGAAQYPPRDVCRVCLSDELAWTETPDAPGTVLATCEVRHSVLDGPVPAGPVPARRIGLVQLPGHVSAVCFIEGDAPARVRASLDARGRAVLIVS